jgi:hypothetical protein
MKKQKEPLKNSANDFFDFTAGVESIKKDFEIGHKAILKSLGNDGPTITGTETNEETLKKDLDFEFKAPLNRNQFILPPLRKR